MDSNKRKISIDANMTISELCMLYLDDKYSKVSLRSYSDYNSKIKIINEYFDNIQLKHFKSWMIESFRYYLENEKQWCYTKGEKVSSVTVNDVIQQLLIVLQQAVGWEIMDKNYKCLLKESVDVKDRLNLNDLYDKYMGIKKRKIAENVERLLRE